MPSYLFTFILGFVFLFLGISNYKGNINTLHSYHRNHVSEENRAPFGRLLGIGMLVISGGMILSSILVGLSLLLNIAILSNLGNAALVVSLIFGIGLTLFAIQKYNGGIIR